MICDIKRILIARKDDVTIGTPNEQGFITEITVVNCNVIN